MKSFRSNLKAISPIFATLILIAIAVIAGVVVYMFTSGTLATMTGGGTAAQEKVAIQAIQGKADTTTAAGSITVYAQSLSGNTVKIDSVIIKNAGGTVIGTISSSTSGAITYVASGVSATGIGTVLTTVNIVVPIVTTTPITPIMAAGTSYTVTLVSTVGGNFVSQSFIAT